MSLPLDPPLWTGLTAAAVAMLLGMAAALAIPIARRAWLRRRAGQRPAEPEQAAELAELGALLQPRAPLPPLGDWAIAPDLALRLARLVQELRPLRVLELGSGASTVVLGYALERAGRGAVLALEHDPEWAERTRRLTAEHGLSRRAHVVDAPLAELPPALVRGAGAGAGSGPVLWYDADVVERIGALAGPAWDLVLVDGPPAARDPQARFPALPVLLPRLAPRAVVVLDDALRPGEQRVVQRWEALGLLAGFRREDVPTHRGAILLHRGG